MGKQFGSSFSWKRATGISRAKSRISRKTGIPLTRSGRRKKVKRMTGCFVATAAYGSENRIEVRFLRKFRDEILVKNIFGRCLISLYYHISPPISLLVEKSLFLKFLSRIILDEVIYIIEKVTHLKKEE